MYYYDNNNLQENDQLVFDCFENKKERRKFVIKTFILFSFSILSTFISCIVFTNNNNLINLIESEIGKTINYISFSCLLFSCFITICFDNLLRKFPINYLIFIIFTLSISYIVINLTIYIPIKIIITTILITLGNIIFLICYSLISKTDYTDYSDFYFMGIFCLIITSTINTFLENSILHTLIIGTGCLLFSLMIVYDIQMIVAQKHIKYKYGINDYILAAMSLYIDSINLFLYILNCLLFSIEN